MDKAKFINIRMGKKGQFVGSLDFGGNKIMPIPPGYCIDESLNGKECSVERVKGIINRILVDGKEIERKTVDNRKGVNRKTGISNRGPNDNNKRKIKDATAPYNFIPLNESIVKSELKEDEIHTGSYNTDEKGIKRVTGYIDLYIETKSPLYIRGTNAADKEKFSDFFAPGGIPRIPGSSLRGMIRTLVEIVSWSKIGFVEYEEAKGKHMPTHHKGKGVLDITEALFGKKGEKKSGFATRLFFEDAVIESNQENVIMEEVVPSILSSPKPTYYPHYLEPKNGKACRWNEDTNIRGHKMYWHRWNDKNPDTWIANEIIIDRAFFEKKDELLKKIKKYSYVEDKEDNKKVIVHKRYSSITDEIVKNTIRQYITEDAKSQYTLIKPVRNNVSFKGIVRFENLTVIELGALLFVLQLPSGIYHRLGMGKPLGLGSIEITPKLIISNRENRYKKLFSEKGWEQAEKPGDIEEYKKTFKEYIVKHVGNSEIQDANSLCETKRIKYLFTMLDYRNVKKPFWREKTEYLELGNFKSKVLPYPEDVDKT